MKTERPAAAGRRVLVPIGAVVAGLAVIFIFGCDDDDGISGVVPRIVDGSGNVIEETRSITNCTAVSFASEGSLHIVQGPPEDLRIVTDDNLLPYLDTHMSGETLEIWTEPGVDLRPSGSIDFYLTVPTLGSIDHAGVGAVEIDGLVTDALSISHEGVGSINLTDLEVTDLDVAMSGLGTVVLSGAPGWTVAQQTVTQASVGNYDAGDLRSTDALVSATGLGSVKVCVTGTLEIVPGSTGSVSYCGNPTVVPPGAATPASGCSCS